MQPNVSLTSLSNGVRQLGEKHVGLPFRLSFSRNGFFELPAKLCSANSEFVIDRNNHPTPHERCLILGSERIDSPYGKFTEMIFLFFRRIIAVCSIARIRFVVDARFLFREAAQHAVVE